MGCLIVAPTHRVRWEQLEVCKVASLNAYFPVAVLHLNFLAEI